MSKGKATKKERKHQLNPEREEGFSTCLRNLKKRHWEVIQRVRKEREGTRRKGNWCHPGFLSKKLIPAQGGEPNGI